jgi:ribonuclease P protein component
MTRPAPRRPEAREDAPGGERFRASARLHTRAEFQRVYEGGRKLHGRHVTMFVLRTAAANSRLGVAATRKIGHAVARNLAKRRLREVFRRHRPAGGLDVVLVARREFFEAPFETLVEEFQALLARANRHDGRRNTAIAGDGR